MKKGNCVGWNSLDTCATDVDLEVSNSISVGGGAGVAFDAVDHSF